MAIHQDPVTVATAAQPGRRLDSLTGLRALAAFIVFAHHVEPLFRGSAKDTLRFFTEHGGAGVTFFFV